MIIIKFSENRYVLFLTENYAALNILKNPNNYLSDELRQNHLKDSTDSSASEPFILFGSSFPKDQEFTQVCICIIDMLFRDKVSSNLTSLSVNEHNALDFLLYNCNNV